MSHAISPRNYELPGWTSGESAGCAGKCDDDCGCRPGCRPLLQAPDPCGPFTTQPGLDQCRINGSEPHTRISIGWRPHPQGLAGTQYFSARCGGLESGYAEVSKHRSGSGNASYSVGAGQLEHLGNVDWFLHLCGCTYRRSHSPLPEHRG